MNEIVNIFITWQFVILCVSISCGTLIFRKLIDFFILENPKIPANTHSRIWRELILPFTPIFIGIGFGALQIPFPYPEALSNGTSKFLFASSAGMLAPIVYRVIVAIFRSQIQLPNSNSSNGPQNVADGDPSIPNPFSVKKDQ